MEVRILREPVAVRRPIPLATWGPAPDVRYPGIRASRGPCTQSTMTTSKKESKRLASFSPRGASFRHRPTRFAPRTRPRRTTRASAASRHEDSQRSSPPEDGRAAGDFRESPPPEERLSCPRSRCSQSRHRRGRTVFVHHFPALHRRRQGPETLFLGLPCPALPYPALAGGPSSICLPLLVTTLTSI